MAEPRDPYLAALKMLAGRELSEAQVRERLVRRGYDSQTIDDAIARLRAERAIDDARVAEGIARTESSVRRHGKLRASLQLERAGIAGPIARRAVDDAFETIDEDTQIETALNKRLRAGSAIADDRQFRRLYRFLVSQGFDADRVLTALTARRRGT